ncbi:MAG: DUF1028 domain-containing protein [Actinobacteria bacterium]|nr:DUF1028 domain-containing protein [Actinomycetota bacterium]
MTYSIVARDEATGQLGVAVQSHWFSVGPIVPWAEAGIGAVATQASVDPGYGPKGLEQMRQGQDARSAIESCLAEDELRAVRQVAMVDASGNVASHTGDECIQAAGHVTGEGFSCQANMMLNDTVWQAMADAYRSAEGDLASRLMAALRGAETEGGDIRGRQSAALLIVAATSTGEPWEDRLVDLRVEDHANPLDELERLLTVHRAYAHMNEFDRRQEVGDREGAWREVAAAEGFAPDNAEIKFWKALALAEAGREDEARALLEQIYPDNPHWAELLRRLPSVGLAPDDPELIERLTRPI